ncbi:DNA-binding protein ESCAROLA-like [Dorcoceras hygrometricum]|uniref:AT-hook motif nuclear-localized protein n=1 Tax=Dorcoceras hygrometricum TaxID=472368 RepID=A0A2Z7BP93_9LAMI|nr:DNA-binding protein ESCAROLA-like [Dorcoceras hygrometricum]
MEGREGMALPGSASYYLHRGGIGGSDSGPSQNIHVPASGSALKPTNEIHPTPIFETLSSNPCIHDVGISGFHVEDTSHSYPHGMSMSFVSSAPRGGCGGGETVKKKRGRPRKYAPDASTVSLAASEGATPAENKPRRGRPPGTGWKQKLAPLGEWMNSSAGLAFTPHVLHVEAGEDIAAKILAFAQQRPRALCILSANGSVSAVTLRQPTTSATAITFEGRFEILCLSGSYLLAESGGPHNRTGGISISICSPDGHIIGGAIGGRLVAANPVQVIACTFVYNGTGTKAKNNLEPDSEEEQYLPLQSAEKSLTQLSPAPTHPHVSETSSTGGIKNFKPEFDLTRG